MNDSPFGKPTQLGHILQQLVRKKGLAEESTQKELGEIWTKAAGERVASKSFVRKLRSGILEIGVSNGAILEELNCYLRHELLPAVQQLHPDPKINSLKFVKTNS